MSALPIRGWRRVRDRELRGWCGARKLAIGKAIAAAGRVERLVRTPMAELFGSVHDTVAERTFFAGVTLDDDDGAVRGVCTCERSACEHAVAVAVAIRAAMCDGVQLPFAERGDVRFSELGRG